MMEEIEAVGIWVVWDVMPDITMMMDLRAITDQHVAISMDEPLPGLVVQQADLTLSSLCSEVGYMGGRQIPVIKTAAMHLLHRIRGTRKIVIYKTDPGG